MKKLLVLLICFSLMPLTLFACDVEVGIGGKDESRDENKAEDISAPEKSETVSDLPAVNEVSEPIREKSFKAVVLGDSIARGYGLENPEAMRFSALLEKSLEAAYEEVDIFNYGVDGRTGGQLLEFLRKDPPKEIKDCDCVIISIGGNNILKMLDTAETAFKALVELDPQAVADYFKYSVAPPEGEEKDKFAYACDTISSVFGAVNAAFESDTFNSLITDAGKRLNEEIPQIIDEIRRLNPDAKIYFQTVYNPYKGINLSLKDIKEPLQLNVYGERAVAELNAPIKALEEELGYEVVPIWSEFDKSGKDLVNAGISLLPFDISVDPHPNRQGHELIAKIYYETITEAKN